jgi:hypothetical protein
MDASSIHAGAARLIGGGALPTPGTHLQREEE